MHGGVEFDQQLAFNNVLRPTSKFEIMVGLQ